jgi:hypothetical protein
MKTFNHRGWIEQRFDNLNIGQMNTDWMSDDNLLGMVQELEIAQGNGLLNLETAPGMLKLQAIVEKHEAMK